MGILKSVLESFKGNEREKDIDAQELAKEIVESVGGSDNIKSYDWCSTRITIYVKNSDSLEISKVKPLLGGIIIKGEKVKYVVGPRTEVVAHEIGELMPSCAPENNRDIALRLLPLLGGSGNIVSLDYCTTRIRLVVTDVSKVDKIGIKKIVPAVITKDNHVQVIVGPEVEFVVNEMKKLISMQKTATPEEKESEATHLAKALIPLLGGKNNIKEVDWYTTRLRLQIEDYSKINADAILEIVPGILERANGVQIIIGPNVEYVAGAMKELVFSKPYEHIAATLIRLLGGAMNIARFQWCSTKLRVKVNDKSKVQIDEIEKIVSGVILDGRDIEIIMGESANKVGEEIERDIE